MSTQPLEATRPAAAKGLPPAHPGGAGEAATEELTWARLDELSREYGDSFYLLDLRTFDRNYARFREAFRAHYSRSEIAYSYKTNYTPALCRRVNDAGGYAEVVSGMEYRLALRVGVAPERIIFNGPVKTHDQLENALLAGSIVNLDGLGEVEVVEALARRFPEIPLRVGLRCNFSIGGDTISRFGFDTVGGALEPIVARLRRCPNVKLLGLHCHFSTRDRSTASFAARTAKLLELCRCHFEPSGPQFIDIGGGFFSPMSEELQRRFGVEAPGYEAYAAAVARQVVEAYPEARPELILEPGSALVADAMRFVARVLEVKTVGPRSLAVVAGSIHNIKPTLHGKNMPVRVFGASPASPTLARRGVCGPVDLVGYTCMEHDCLHHGYESGVSIGDYAVFDNIGAYTNVMKPPFIQPSPAMIAVKTVKTAAGESAVFELVKQRETASDLFTTYRF